MLSPKLRPKCSIVSPSGRMLNPDLRPLEAQATRTFTIKAPSRRLSLDRIEARQIFDNTKPKPHEVFFSRKVSFGTAHSGGSWRARAEKGTGRSQVPQGTHQRAQEWISAGK